MGRLIVMVIMKRLGQARRVGRAVVHRPAELRNVPRLAATVGRPTLTTQLPWLPFVVIDYLDRVVDRHTRVFEYGSGGSTAWLAQRAGHVISVEHDVTWAANVGRVLGDRENVDLRLVPAVDGSYDAYVAEITSAQDQSFDLVIVDGRERVRCVEAAAPKIAPGGMLLLDDSSRPKYARAHAALSTWPQVTVTGLAPGKDYMTTTTIWRPPTTRD